MGSAFEIISQICWLVQLLDCLLSLAAISVLPLLTLLCCWDYSSLPLAFPSFPHTCQISLRIVFFRVSQLNIGLHHAGPGDACTPGLVPDEFALGSQVRWDGMGTDCRWKHGRSSSAAVNCFTNVLVPSAVAGVPRLEAASSTAATSKWYTQQNPACCLYPGEDVKQVFWQLSDTQIPPPVPTCWPAQSQEPLLLLPGKNGTPLPGTSHHQQAMHVCMVWTHVHLPCRNVPSHWRWSHHVKNAGNGNRICQIRCLEKVLSF